MGLARRTLLNEWQSVSRNSSVMDALTFNESVERLRPMAEEGDPVAQFKLGVCYMDGRGVSQNEFKAVEFLRRAAYQGYAPGQYNLGRCYNSGFGVPADRGEAVKWYSKAAEQGDTSAQLALYFAYKRGNGVIKNQQESIHWLRLAAEAGNPAAQLLLGFAFEIGQLLPLDIAESTRWIQRAAEARHAGAQSYYGQRLLYGKLANKNPVEAVLWLRKAAAQGDASGEYYLGICCSKGLGTERNFDEARKWFQLAAEQDYRDSKYRLRLLFFEKYSIAKWRDTIFMILGWSLLVFYGIHSPFSVNGLAVAAFLGILIASGTTFVAVMGLLQKIGMKGLDDNDTEAISERLISYFKRNPLRFLYIPAEDGLFLLPLVFIGINPISAALAAALFGAAHYPSFPWRFCVPKGIAYFFVALFVLPYGIWSVVVAHLLIDATAIAALALVKIEGKSAWQRLFRILGTK
jgi:uncharacterized protein